MKTIIFTLLLTIFFAGNICKAQRTKNQVSICNLKGQKIAEQDIKMPVDSVSQQISLTEIKNLLESGCDKIIHTKTSGEELKVSNIMFAYTFKNGNSYFEQAKGDRLTKTMKEKLQNVVSGEKIMIAVDVNSDINYSVAHKPKALVFYKVVE